MRPSRALLPCGGGFSRAAHIGGRGVEFSTLVTSLSSWVDRVVIDRTGLSGKFDWDLQWTPEALTTAASPQGSLSIFTALSDQLGFKLEPQRDSVDVLVVERVERPLPD
jgi:uncharacterized protein (TIGR03435 family)